MSEKCSECIQFLNLSNSHSINALISGFAICNIRKHHKYILTSYPIGISIVSMYRATCAAQLLPFVAITNASGTASEAGEGSLQKQMKTQMLQTERQNVKLQSRGLLGATSIPQSKSSTSLRVRSHTFDNSASPMAGDTVSCVVTHENQMGERDERERDRAASASSATSRKMSGASGRASNSSDNLLSPNFGTGCYDTSRRLSEVPPSVNQLSAESPESLRRFSLVPPSAQERERHASEKNEREKVASTMPTKRPQPQPHMPMAIPVIKLVEDTDGGRSGGENGGISPSLSSREIVSPGSQTTMSPSSQTKAAAYRERKTPTWDAPGGPQQRPTPALRAFSDAAATGVMERPALTPTKSPNRFQQQQLQSLEAYAPLKSLSHRETNSSSRNNDGHVNMCYAQKSVERARNVLQEKNANGNNGVIPLPSASLRSPHSPVSVSKSVGTYGHKALQQQLRHQQQRQAAAVGERRGAKPLKLNLLGFSTSNDSNDSTPPSSLRFGGAHYAMDRTRSVDSAASAASESTRMADTSSIDSEELVVALPAPRQQQQLQHGNQEAAGGSMHMTLPQLPRTTTPRFPKIGFSPDRCDSGYRSQETTASTCATASFSTSFQSAYSRTGALVSSAQSFQSFDHQPAFKGKKTASTKRRLFVARGRLTRGSDQRVTLEGPAEESEQSSSLSPSVGDGDGSGDGDVYADELELPNSQSVINSQHQLTTGSGNNGGSGAALTPVKRMLPTLPDLKAQVLSPDVPLQAHLHALSRSPRHSLNTSEEGCTSPTKSQLQWPQQTRECPKSSPTRRKLPTIPTQQQHGQDQKQGTTASSPGSRDTLTPSSAHSPTQRSPRETSPQRRTYTNPPPLHLPQRQLQPCLQLTSAPSPQYRNTYELDQTYCTASGPEGMGLGAGVVAGAGAEVQLCTPLREAAGLAICGGGVRAELPAAGLPRQWTLQVPGAAEATATTLISGVYGRSLHSAQEPRTTRLGSYYGTELLDPEAQQSLLNRLRSRSFDAQTASNL